MLLLFGIPLIGMVIMQGILNFDSLSHQDVSNIAWFLAKVGAKNILLVFGT